MKLNPLRIGASALGGVLLVGLLGAYALTCSYIYVLPSLPSVESMRKVELQVPLRVYTRSGALIAQIGEQRRIPVTYEQIPAVVKNAFLAARSEERRVGKERSSRWSPSQYKRQRKQFRCT